MKNDDSGITIFVSSLYEYYDNRKLIDLCPSIYAM